MKPVVPRPLPAFLATLLLAACGGGAGPAAPAAGSTISSTTLSGTAATGAPVAGGQVAVTCGTAAPVTATTAANGSWQVDVPEAVFPCIVAVSGGSLPAGVNLYGYATAATNVNVTPLTTLIGAYALRAANGATLTQALLDAAVGEVNGLLATAGLPPLPDDPLTVTFTPVPGDAYDDYLESVMATLASQDVALADLVEQITTSGGPAAPIKAATIDFSDNTGSAMVVQDGTVQVLQLDMQASTAAAPNFSHNTGVKGNRANWGTEVFHGMKVADFPGITFKHKEMGPVSGASTPYLNYTVSKQCDGNPDGWANLVTISTNMNRSGPDGDGYTTYTAGITTITWRATRVTTGLPLLGSGTSASLEAFIAAHPDACIYNWPNPNAANPEGAKTPAVMLMIGSSNNLRAARGWFKDVRIGEVVLF